MLSPVSLSSPGRRAALIAALTMLAGLTVVAVKLSVARAAVSPTMHGFVHEDDSIGLTFDDGSQVGNQSRNVPVIPPGTYSVQVLDDATAHNFHLQGPGIDQQTDIGGTATPTWSITLRPGETYKFVCDNHPDFMYGTFLTSGTAAGGSSSGGSSSGGSSSSGGTSSSGSSSSGGVKAGGSASGSGTALRGTLLGTVGASGRLTLSVGGSNVKDLKAGRYKVTVVDRAKNRSFVLKGPGRTTTVSGVTTVGTHTATVTLTAGKWTYSTTSGPKFSGSFVVVA